MKLELQEYFDDNNKLQSIMSRLQYSCEIHVKKVSVI